MSYPESNEAIKNRMLKEISEKWGYENESTDVAAEFDPLVNLLTSACAKEFEKISYEIHASRQRILNRLVDFLTPDVLTGPSPAHSIAQARPIRATYLTRRTDTYFVQRKSKELYFSPIPAIKLVNGNIRYRAIGNQLTHAKGATEEIVYTRKGQSLNPHSLWLGIELDEAVGSLAGLSFYFHWPNELQGTTKLYTWLKLTRWHLDETVLPIYPELVTFPEDKGHTNHSLKFTTAYHTSLGIEQNIFALYRDQFITLSDTITTDWKQHKKYYPAQFESIFPLEALENLKEKLVWIEVQFPDFFPVETLKRTFCALNCFPLINRRLHQKSMYLQESVSLLALETDDSFLDIQQVVDSEEVEYHEIPLNNLRNYTGGTYSLRKEGVGKLNQRSATDYLQHLTNLLREESSAFAAYNKKDYLSKKIVQLNQEIAELEQSIDRQANQQEATPYVMIKPRKQGSTIHLTYWSTAGADANQVPGGSALEIDNAAVIQRSSIKLLRTTRGGKDELKNDEKIYAYKQALLSRGRIVSMEDIRTYCWAQLGSQVAQIDITKGVDAGTMPNQGLSRVLLVHLKPSAEGNNAGTEEWQERSRQLEIQLNSISTGIIPIRVIVNYN